MTLVYFILILGVTVLVHESGHFIFAKRAGIYVYEFAIGMGPRLLKFKRKNDETIYSIRLVPIGGFVQLAGEEIEADKNIPDNMRTQSKTWLQRFLVIVAGCMFNFIFAFILLLSIGFFYGAPELKPYIGKTLENYPAEEAGLEKNDLILKVNGESVATSDDVLLYFQLHSNGKPVVFEIQKASGDIEKYTITPSKEKDEKGNTTYKYGIIFTDKINYGLGVAFNFAFTKFGSIFNTMFLVLTNLITGGIGINSLAGPVGIYNIVGEEASLGFENIIYLIAFLSINIGFVNLLPFPAFDGGRLLFLVIEKIKGSKVNPKVENIIHAVGFALLLLLMIFVTINDISRLS